MNITIFGATGFVGNHLLSKALAEGHKVKILARDPKKVRNTHANLEIIEGDYFDLEKVRQAISGSEAILSTVGPKPRSSADQTKEMYLQSLETVFDGMKNDGVNRFINILGAATVAPGEKVQTKRKLVRFIIGIIGPHIKDTKQAELELIRKSGLEWTSVRPPLITECSGDFKAHAETLAGGKVDVHQLVGFLLENLNTTDWVGKAPLVSTV